MGTKVLPGDRLSDADALMWRIETDPVLRSPILVVGELDSAPPFAAVLEAFDRTARAIPRLRQRVVSAGPLVGQLRWADDPAFDVAHHVHERMVRRGAGFRGALDLAGEEAAAAFDPARPPWTAAIVRGLPDRRAALVLRFHHAITDGVGGIDLADRLFDPIAGGRSRPGDGPGSTDGTGTRRSGTDYIGSGLRLVRAMGSTVADPVGAVRDSLRTVRSVGRLLAPAREPLSPLLAGRGIDRELHVFDVPLAAFHDAAASCESTINDVFLGVVGGALREYHDQLGQPVRALRFTMPVNRRTTADAPGGNRFTPVRFVLSVDADDLAGRAREAGQVSRGWRSEPSLGFTDLLASALNQLPDPAVTAAFAGMLRSVDVDAVDVPGLTEPMALAGARVERLFAFAPPTGAALSVTLLSHVELACVALECDTAAVAEPRRLADCVAGALDEVVALAGTHPGGTS